MSRHPEVLWAQRSDKVYLTISLPDANDVAVKTEPEGLFNFSAIGAQGEAFTFSLELYGTIVPDSSKVRTGLRNITCILHKEKKGWWERLLKPEGKPAPYIKADWNRWCDEDEEESADLLSSEEEDNGEEESNGDDDDDDGLLYLPDLEKARKAL